MEKKTCNMNLTACELTPLNSHTSKSPLLDKPVVIFILFYWFILIFSSESCSYVETFTYIFTGLVNCRTLFIHLVKRVNCYRILIYMLKHKQIFDRITTYTSLWTRSRRTSQIPEIFVSDIAIRNSFKI